MVLLLCLPTCFFIIISLLRIGLDLDGIGEGFLGTSSSLTDGGISSNHSVGRSSIMIFVLVCKLYISIKSLIVRRISLLIGPTKCSVHLAGFAFGSSSIGNISA